MARKRTSEHEIVVSPAAGTVPARRQATAAAAPRVRRPVKAKEAPRSAELPSTPSIAAAAPAVAANYQPSADQIAALAYAYWEARGCQGGSPEEDWLRAESEIRSMQASAHA